MSPFAEIKSMELFCIDNQQVWGRGAQLIGDYVVWPDDGYYPGFAPVGILTHPNYKGRVVMQAGNRGLVVTFCPDAETGDDCKRALMSKERPEQYRISVEAIVHRLMLAGAGSDTDISAAPVASHGKGLDALAMVAWLAKSCPKEAAVIEAALKHLAKSPAPLTYGAGAETKGLVAEDVYQVADDMLVTIGQVQRGA